MIKLKKLLSESKFKFNFKTLRDAESGGKYYKNARENSTRLIDYFYEDNKELKKSIAIFIKQAEEAGNKALNLLGNVPYYNESNLIETLLSFEEIPTKVQDFFPIPIYVSSGKNDRATIGILVHWNGKKEMFEGNDEATDATIAFVNRILGIGTKKVIVWGSHNTELVHKIKQTKIIPKGLYVSPLKRHAEGYFGHDRNLFSCEIKMGDISQESDVDWKTITNAKVDKVKIY